MLQAAGVFEKKRQETFSCLLASRVVFVVVIADNPEIIIVITLGDRLDWSADPLRCCWNSPGHTPSGCSSHDQNCCGVFDRDDCLQVFLLHLDPGMFFLMYVTSDT